MSEDLYLNLAEWEERSIVHGPGERFVLWVQGCPFRCPGCFNPAMQPFTENKLVKVETMAETIFSVKDIEGVTYSGGEPMAQAKALAKLSEILKNKGLTIVSYTGYTLKDLKSKKDKWIEKFLSYIDILIDGPFLKEMAANLLWRGSSNQIVHFLSDTYKHYEPLLNQKVSQIEFTVDDNGFVTTGFWSGEFIRNLEKKLREI